MKGRTQDETEDSEWKGELTTAGVDPVRAMMWLYGRPRVRLTS
jgi:hypothetical protein